DAGARGKRLNEERAAAGDAHAKELTHGLRAGAGRIRTRDRSTDLGDLGGPENRWRIGRFRPVDLLELLIGALEEEHPGPLGHVFGPGDRGGGLDGSGGGGWFGLDLARRRGHRLGDDRGEVTWRGRDGEQFGRRG